MSVAKVRTYYRRWAPFYDATRWFFLFDRGLGIRRLGLKPGDSVLEIGAGTGKNLRYFADAVGPTGRITLLDFSPEMLRRASRKRRAFPGHHVDLLCADATDFALRHAYDAVVFCYSLALIPDRYAALACGLRHLTPGGTFGVIEFGASSRLGPIGRAFWRWLNLHNVYACDRELAAFGTANLDPFEIEFRRFGYNLIATGTAPS